MEQYLVGRIKNEISIAQVQQHKNKTNRQTKKTTKKTKKQQQPWTFQSQFSSVLVNIPHQPPLQQTIHFMFYFQDESGKYCAEAKNILHKVEPSEGMAILFNHHRLHEGAALGQVKLICAFINIYLREFQTYCTEKKKGAEIAPLGELFTCP